MKIVLDLAPHDVTRAVEALRESRGMIAMEVAEKIEAAATEAGKVDITDLVSDLTAPSPGVASPGGRFACSPDSILPESTTDGATTFPPHGADDAPDESKGAVPNAASAPASTFGEDWDELLISRPGDDAHFVAICPTCHALVDKYIWQGGNTLHEHAIRLHPGLIP